MGRRTQRTQAQRAADEDTAGQQVITAADDAVRARHAAKARKTEREILKGIEAANSMGKPIAFPNVRTFSTLFPSVSVVKSLSGYQSKEIWKTEEAVRLLPDGRSDNRGVCTISEYIGVDHRGHNGLRMDSIPQTMIDWVLQNMMVTDGHTINFRVTVRDNGTSLVTAFHSLLSTSRWLAIVHASSVPGLEGI